MRHRALSQSTFHVNHSLLTSQFVRVYLSAISSRGRIDSARFQLYRLCVIKRYVVTESYVIREVKPPNRQRCDRHGTGVVIDGNLGVVPPDIDHHRTCVTFVAGEHLLRLGDDRGTPVDRFNASLPHCAKDAVVMHKVAHHQASLYL